MGADTIPILPMAEPSQIARETEGRDSELPARCFCGGVLVFDRSAGREIGCCDRCGYEHTPAIVETPVADLYAGGHPTTFQGSEGRRFSPGVAWLRRLVARSRAKGSTLVGKPAPQRLLDFGCGQGYLLEAFVRLGIDGVGVEISPESARFARARGLQVEMGIDSLSRGSFEAVTSVHVLEHIDDLPETVETISTLLAPGARFHFEVPHYRGLQAAWFRHRWLQFEADLHRHHFSIDALRGLLEPRGFQIDKVTTFSFELGWIGWIQSLYNLALPYNRFFRSVVLNRPLKDKLRCWPEVLLLPVTGLCGAVLLAVEALVPDRGPVLRVEGHWRGPSEA